MLRHQLPSLCSLFISFILQNEGADIQNTAMSWGAAQPSTEVFNVPMSNKFSSTFLSQIPRADVSHAKVVLWLSTFAYNRSSDLLLIQTYVLSFPSSVISSTSRYSASVYKKLLNPNAQFSNNFSLPHHLQSVLNTKMLVQYYWLWSLLFAVSATALLSSSSSSHHTSTTKKNRSPHFFFASSYLYHQETRNTNQVNQNVQRIVHPNPLNLLPRRRRHRPERLRRRLPPRRTRRPNSWLSLRVPQPGQQKHRRSRDL